MTRSDFENGAYCHSERSEESRPSARQIVRCAQNDKRAGFTLFELILAIALSAVLLSLIGMAINLYLKRVDASRSRVEEAQLARSILAMIADDIRATTVYQPQDTAAIAQLMSKTSTFNVDEIDAKNTTETGGAVSGSSSAASTSSAGQTSTSGSTNDPAESDSTMPLGVNGSIEELYVDATRLPRQDELFNAATGYTNAPSPTSDGGTASTDVAPPTDLKTVHYFVRSGESVEPGSAATTSLNPDAQARAGGLVRQETPRAERVFAEQNGGSDVSDSGQALVAPEVVRVEFHYFDGSQIIDTWDMKERKTLPLAIEVCLWIRSASAADQPDTSSYDAAALASSSHEYRQRVNLPMALVMNSSQTSDSGESSSTDSSGSSTNESSGSSGSGSSFNQP